MEGRQDNFRKFLTGADADIKAYRGKFKWVNGSYRAGYENYSRVIKDVNAGIDSEQVWVNLIFSFAGNLAIGALGSALQSAKLISEGLAIFGGAAASTAVGFKVPPQIEKAPPSEELHPAIREAEGLKTLDSLNAMLLEIVTKGLDVFSEPRRLTAQVIGEIRVKAAGGKRELTDAELEAAIAKIDANDKSGEVLDKAVLDTIKSFDETRQFSYKAPWPDMRRAEQDIWIMWIARQNPIGRWGVVRWSVLARPELTRRLIDLNLATENISPHPDGGGGRLGAATEGVYMVINGQWVARSGPEMIKTGAIALQPQVARYWAAVLLSGTTVDAKGNPLLFP
jgi:hypothetical protein